jgi:hypothetical protein
MMSGDSIVENLKAEGESAAGGGTFWKYFH